MEIFVFEENLEKLKLEKLEGFSEKKNNRDQCETICKVCGKLIKYKHNRHMLIHSPNRPYSCPVCLKSFRLRAILSSHLKTHYSGHKPFKCNECGQQFLRKSTLVIHNRIHTGLRPFMCHVCSESFSQQAILVRHLDTHSDKKIFHCEQCNTSYRRKSSLETHLKSLKHMRSSSKENES